MSECILCMLIHTLHYMPCSFSRQIHRSPPTEFILSINYRTLCQIRSWKSWFLGHLRAGNSEVQGQGQRRCLLQWVLFYASTFLSDYSHERNLGTVVGSKLINSLKEEHEVRHMLSQGDRGQSKSWHCRYLSHLLTIVNTNTCRICASSGPFSWGCTIFRLICLCEQNFSAPLSPYQGEKIEQSYQLILSEKYRFPCLWICDGEFWP